ncbi:hypothetical protein C7H19_07435 [Aphanothece hegewaldii CCALA 016]|uniref:Glycosyltransferase 2-like domain-containing protein n=1 Tax=Aphanothece hegewaldii CCALA 016 TaxID=2107694 RepID=A0A2T1LZG0_9CHRO|nr:glycosyltransferase [Aphanothece hegewaldii]PSF37809.1 hypothetical protein C7H19_07435 [Aphanothece hegewaldii CCALA 016]
MLEQNLSKMSVILPTPDTYETIAKTLSYLRKQTVKESLEIIIVAPSVNEIAPQVEQFREFYQIKTIAIPDMHSLASAYAAGIHQATSPIVALAEDHCFPDPDWAEHLIQAHQQPWAVVGPVLRNGNPESSVSWADMLIAYAPWLEPTSAGIVDFLPGHNSSYKREILLIYGSQLEAMMEAETILHWDLRAKGYQLYLEPLAKASHTNFGQLLVWLRVQFYCGRLFAGARCVNEQWSLSKRLLYVVASPLIPLMRLSRIWQHLQERQLQSLLSLKLLLTLILGLVVDGIGQGIGYGVGGGNAMEKLSKFEFHRDRYSHSPVNT